MKKLITLILLTWVIASCDNNGIESNQYQPHSNILDTNAGYYDQHYKVYTLEGCEYILVNYGTNSWGSHKGNCSNPIHQKQ